METSGNAESPLSVDPGALGDEFERTGRIDYRCCQSDNSGNTTCGEFQGVSNVESTPFGEKGKRSTPIGRPYRRGDGRRRGPRPLIRQERYQRAIQRLVTLQEWYAVCRSMLEIAKNPSNRQAVAAATWISDRTAGPIMRQMQVDVMKQVTIEDRRLLLHERLQEILPATSSPVPQLPVPDDAASMPDAPSTSESTGE